MTSLLPEGFRQTADIFEVLYRAMGLNSIVRAEIQAIDYPGGIPTWIISFPDIEGTATGLVPASETGLDEVLMPRFLQQIINIKVKGIDRENGIVACSRKDAVDSLKEKLNLEKDQLVTCTVRAIRPNPDGRPYLMVDVGGGVMVDIPFREARVAYTRSLSEQYRIGQNVSAKVISIDNDGQAELSIRATRNSPWETANFNSGQLIGGTVWRISGTKVFIEPDLNPGIVGIAEYPARGALRPRQKVKCIVASFNGENRRLRLRIRGGS